MRIYFDMEFTGLFKTAEVISIGCVDTEGKQFYGECTDFNKDVDPWITENVIGNLLFNDRPPFVSMADDNHNDYMVKGTTEEVGKELAKWLSFYDSVELYSDVHHYDMVLFVDLVTHGKSALDLPKNITADCWNLDQEIATVKNIPLAEAFDVTREDLAFMNIEDPAAKKHNSLWDAWVIKACFEELEKVPSTENKNLKTILCAGFPATGKSYFVGKSGLKVLDSDSSTFDKKDFPENYIKHIKDNIGKVDVILISTHKEVREALVKNNINFVLVYPKVGLKEEYIQRYKQRGSTEGFIKLLSANWNNWLKELHEQEGCEHIVLGPGEYISDIVDSHPSLKLPNIL